MVVNHNKAWPFNFLGRIFDQEQLKILKCHAPKELEALLKQATEHQK